ncbi:MAG: DUF1697 domain-containing protein [Pseudomonadales bacterium]|jgi:uncharacterized protein (DUF1697 family)|nr:DUF1697 domain-containing protein [Pseudomonadales bacterium]MDP6469811.1 DUF1697 domain-containing protein [Pseudomonadales bacterium]MDP6827587.1 DUF1697 domain-containing protein [Pseudomonadales bacterium]MDP6971281.1 DUF1697 domain-containing protein [Pseudomonadales bacterium]|tara:strand:- start:2131 stop:2679 length:549 start_codon:yes stop_codon:yes gene_type:complete
MSARTAFIKGINVGRHRKLPMAELRAMLETLGYRNLATYIQSGNAVFATEKPPGVLEDEISHAIADIFSFSTDVRVLTLAEPNQIIDGNPFPNAVSDPRRLHVWLLDEPTSKADPVRLSALATGHERFQLDGKVAHRHTPDGIGRSKLADAATRTLGTAATACNWRTPGKVAEMARMLKADP